MYREQFCTMSNFIWTVDVFMGEIASEVICSMSNFWTLRWLAQLSILFFDAPTRLFVAQMVLNFDFFSHTAIPKSYFFVLQHSQLAGEHDHPPLERFGLLTESKKMFMCEMFSFILVAFNLMSTHQGHTRPHSSRGSVVVRGASSSEAGFSATWARVQVVSDPSLEDVHCRNQAYSA